MKDRKNVGIILFGVGTMFLMLTVALLLVYHSLRGAYPIKAILLSPEAVLFYTVPLIWISIGIYYIVKGGMK